MANDFTVCTDPCELRRQLEAVTAERDRLLAEKRKTRYLPTASGGFIDLGQIYLGSDGRTVELLEWSKDLGSASFEKSQKLAAELGPEWQVASPHEWTGIFNYEREDPATDAPVANAWHWTRQADPSSSDLAIYVYLGRGNVSRGMRNSRGRVRAVRRVRASQYLDLIL